MLSYSVLFNTLTGLNKKSPRCVVGLQAVSVSLSFFPGSSLFKFIVSLKEIEGLLALLYNAIAVTFFSIYSKI